MKNTAIFLSFFMFFISFSACQKDTQGLPNEDVNVPTHENLAGEISGTYTGLFYNGENMVDDFEVEIVRIDNITITWRVDGWPEREVTLMRDTYLTNGIVSVGEVTKHIVAYLPDTEEISITIYDDNGELLVGYSGER